MMLKLSLSVFPLTDWSKFIICWLVAMDCYDRARRADWSRNTISSAFPMEGEGEMSDLHHVLFCTLVPIYTTTFS